ncbi:hypothetical protein ACWGNM_35470 [Streptomyces sp. NPDC055796]
MFIRPIGTRVEPARRPTGRPLLQGLLARAAGRPEPSGPTPAESEPAEFEPAAPAAAGPAAAGHKAAGHKAADQGIPPAGLAAELAQLANLAREGLLTPQEFKEAKTRLLHS